MTKITAHKGFSRFYPENTLEAFRAAINAGADRLEFDVHMSSDGELFVHHDYYLGRTDNGSGLLLDMESEYLETLDCGSWFSDVFNGVTMPRLTRVLQEFGSMTEFEIELRGFSRNFLRKVLRAIPSRLFDRIEFTSPHLPLLVELKRARPLVSIGAFATHYPNWMDRRLGHLILLETLDLVGADVAHCPLAILDEHLVSSMHRMGKRVHASNCNYEEEIRSAFTLNVDQLSTNDVKLAVEIRQSLRRIAA